MAFEIKDEGLNTNYMIGKKERDDEFIKNIKFREDWGNERIQPNTT